MMMIEMIENDQMAIWRCQQYVILISDTFVLNLRFFPFMNVLAAVIALGKFHFTNNT